MSKRIFNRPADDADESAKPKAAPVAQPALPVVASAPTPTPVPKPAAAPAAGGDYKKADAFQTAAFPTWCPGCGNFSMWTAFKHAAAELKLDPEQTFIVHGIGCAGNGANFIKAYEFHGLHGRALPVAEGAHLANPEIKLIAMGGDGDMYGLGLSHLVHAMRRNFNITTIIHNNQIYGLTTGQTSPTSARGFKSKSTPFGAIDEPVNPIPLALASGATFIARTFSGDIPATREIYKQALQHKGFAIVDVFQPCITFNKINTYQWYREHVYQLSTDTSYDPTNRAAAFARSLETDRLPIGIFYQEQRSTYEDEVFADKQQPIAHHDISNVSVKKLMEEFI